MATLNLPTTAQAFSLAQYQKYLFVSPSDSLRVYLFDQGAFTMVTDYPPQLGQLTPIAISGRYFCAESPVTGIFWILTADGPAGYCELLNVLDCSPCATGVEVVARLVSRVVRDRGRHGLQDRVGREAWAFAWACKARSDLSIRPSGVTVPAG